MQIRESIIQDLEWVINLRYKLWEYEKITSEITIRIPDMQEIILEVSKYYEWEWKCFVLDDNWKVVGLVYWIIQKTASYINDFDEMWYVEVIYLEESYRGKWWWSKLMWSLIEWFESKKMWLIQLWVLANNIDAINSYESQWFEKFYTRMIRVRK